MGNAASWVSALSKQLMAQDAMLSLASILGSATAVEQWLASGAAEVAALRQQHSSEVLLADDAGGCPPVAKRRREGSGEHLDDNSKCPAAAATVNYAWLKDAAGGAAFVERRKRFHSSGPFVHWPRKRSISFSTTVGAGPGEPAFVEGLAKTTETKSPVDDFAVATAQAWQQPSSL